MAGSNYYGFLARIWQFVGIEFILLFAVGALAIGTWHFMQAVWRIGMVKIKRIQTGAAGVFLLLAWLDWGLISTLVYLKKGIGLD